MITHLDRETFLRDYWAYRPGEHVSLIEPTQGGKTTLAYQLLDATMADHPDLRVVTAVPKPRDPATRRWADKLDLKVVPDWPPPWTPFGKPRGYALWPKHIKGGDDKANREHLARTFRKMMDEQYWQGNSLTLCDDAYLMAVLLEMNDSFEKHLTAGGGMGSALWMTNQKPSGTVGGGALTSFAYNAPTHLFLGHDPDERNVKRFSEIGGVDPKLVAGIVSNLEVHHVNGKNVSDKLYIHRGGPYMATIGL